MPGKKNNIDKKKELIKARKAIKKKIKSLRDEKFDVSKLFRSRIDPITEPIKTLIKTIKTELPIKHEIKPEKSITKTSTEDEPDTFSAEEGPDFLETDVMAEYTPRTNISLDAVQDIYGKDDDSKRAFENIVKNFGADIQYYLRKMVADTSRSFDHMYGIRYDSDGWKIGDTNVEIDGDDFIIDGVRYRGSPGLYELMFLKIPNEKIYTQQDLNAYKSIILSTNAHKRRYMADERINSNRGYKYINVISKLFPSDPRSIFVDPTHKIFEQKPQRRRVHSTIGGAMRWKKLSAGSKIEFKYWNTADEIIDRLRELLAEQQAGNDSPLITNEITNIIEELKEENII